MRRTEFITGVRWKGVDPKIEARIFAVAKGWENTLFVDGQCAKQQGTDCTHLLVGVFDELFRRVSRTVLPRFSPDAGLHSVKPGLRVARMLRTSYDSFVVRDNTIEPGDVIAVAGTAAANVPPWMGHVMIACGAPYQALHAIYRDRVRFTSIPSTKNIIRIYRPRFKEAWL